MSFIFQMCAIYDTLSFVLYAHKEFAARVEFISDRSITKPTLIRMLFDSTLRQLSKRMILEKYPDISASMVEVTLAALLKDGYITKTGVGKSTAYVRNFESSNK